MSTRHRLRRISSPTTAHAVRRTRLARATACFVLAVVAAACSDPLTFHDAASVSPSMQPVVDLAELPRWSNASTWPGGRVPANGDTVRIAAGRHILLDTATADLTALHIEGVLMAEPGRDVGITSGAILVHGEAAALVIGREEAPHAGRATIRLTGAPDDRDLMGMGAKVLGVMGGGLLDLHGADAARTDWTRLAEDASPGATSLKLAESVNWRVGDTIVIAPSGFDPAETEVVAITAIDGVVVQVAPALRARHLGLVQEIEGRRIDMRAEVGLLSRNIRIESDADAVASRFGGHVMIMGGGSRARIEGVTFRNLGQEGRLGRYAMHWHFVGDGTGQYLRHSSVHTSFTRGAVVHATGGVTVEGVVGYESHSHMFVAAEDGSEQGNVLRGNLGVLVRRHADATRRIFFNSGGGSESGRVQDEHRPSVFWSANPNHTFDGNVAVGATNGSGFHFASGFSSRMPARLVFRDNVAHGNRSHTGGNDRYPPNTHGYGLFLANFGNGKDFARAWRFAGLTAYKNSIGGAWLENEAQTLTGGVLADNGTGAVVFRSRVERTLIVGQSANDVGAPPRIGTSMSGGIHIMRGQGGEKRPSLDDITIVDQRDGGLVLLPEHVSSGAQSRGLRFVRSAPLAFDPHWSGFWYDADGSLTGTGRPGVVLPARSALVAAAGCALHGAAAPYAFWHCRPDASLGMLRITADVSGGSFGDPMTATDANGARVRLDAESRKPTRWAYVAAGGRYTVSYPVRPPVRQRVRLDDWRGTGAVEVAIPSVVAARAYPVQLGSRNRESPNFAAPIPLASSLEAMRAAAGPSSWRDSETGRLHVNVGPGLGLFVCGTSRCE